MKKGIFLLSFSLILVSCSITKSSKTYGRYTPKEEAERTRNLKSYSNSKKDNKVVQSVLINAEGYIGTPYRLGGMSSSGFDCSGLVAKVFEENNIKISRRSVDQAKEGKEIRISEVKNGDLLFFATAGGSKVSHVGIVSSVESSGEIRFIHSSTRKGVIISSLNDIYWNKVFLFARRVIF